MFILKYVFIFLPLLISVAFLTLAERKLLSLIGLRLGPNKVSFLGLLQPLGDAAKLINKGPNVLRNFNPLLYYISTFFMFSFRLGLTRCLFLYPYTVSLKFSLLFFFLILGFNSFNSIISGWSTFGKYPLIGSLRTVSQLISYEAVLYICLFTLILYNISFDLSIFSFFPLNNVFLIIIPCVYIWFPRFLAELNRTPFDFSEGERELVRGFNTDFGSLGFTLIFLSEYFNIVFFCILTSFIFFDFFLSYFFFITFFVIWIRSVLPRFRFDKLIGLAWTFFIPLITLYLLFLRFCLF